jgi:signal transduction histidine kinase
MEPNLPNGCITLAESNGDVLYRWGNYEPAQKEPPQVSLELSPPLHSWKLHFFAPGQELAAAFGRTALFQLVSGLAVVGMALLGLAEVFYREYSREIREATQRVTFVNQVSHELRTPLTNIRMYAELLENVAGEDPEKSSRYLSIILSESQRLSRLISNVLTFGRQQKETLKLHLTSGNVDEVIASVIEQFRPSMETRGIEISVSRGAGAEVLLDADALQQILGNLFSNVEKYAATGKFMAVASQQTTDQTTITVTDRGPGIPATQEEKIFRPFYRISDKVSEGVTGTGIGLSIARHLARLHGGDVVLILSTTGACFRVTLHAPRAEAARS